MTQKRWSRYLGCAAGVGLITMVLMGTPAGPAIAQGLKPISALIVNGETNPVPVRGVGLTRVGRPASDLVQLQWGGISQQCFVRQLPTAELEPHCYTPPSGHSLVITDVQWWGITGPTSPGAFVLFELLIFGKGIVFQGTALAGTNGAAGNNHHLQSGFIFHQDLVPNLNARLNGFLVPNE